MARRWSAKQRLSSELRASLLRQWHTGRYTLNDLLKRAPRMKRSSLHRWLSAQPNPLRDAVDDFCARLPSEEFVKSGKGRVVVQMGRAMRAIKRRGCQPGPRHKSVKFDRDRQFARLQKVVNKLLGRREKE